MLAPLKLDIETILSALLIILPSLYLLVARETGPIFPLLEEFVNISLFVLSNKFTLSKFFNSRGLSRLSLNEVTGRSK